MKTKVILKDNMSPVYIHFLNNLKSAYSLEESQLGEIKGKGILAFELDALSKYIFSNTEKGSELRSKLFELHRLFLLVDRLAELKKLKQFSSSEDNLAYKKILSSGEHMLKKMQSSISEVVGE